MSRDRTDGNLISHAQLPCNSLTHIIYLWQISTCKHNLLQACRRLTRAHHICTHTRWRMANCCRFEGYFLLWSVKKVERRRRIMTCHVYLPFDSFKSSHMVERALQHCEVDTFWTEITTTGNKTLTSVMFLPCSNLWGTRNSSSGGLRTTALRFGWKNKIPTTDQTEC